MRLLVNVDENSTQGINRSWLAFLQTPNNDSIEEMVMDLCPVVSDSQVSLGRVCRWNEIGQNGLTYEAIEQYAIPGDNDRITVAGCALFNILPFEYIPDIPNVDSIDNKILVDYMRQRDEFYPIENFEVIKLIYTFMPYQAAVQKNPILSLITVTLQYLLGAIKQFEEKVVMKMQLDQPGRSSRVSLAWKLREEIMELVSELGEKYSSTLCNIEELQDEMNAFVTKMVTFIAKKEKQLSEEELLVEEKSLTKEELLVEEKSLTEEELLAEKKTGGLYNELNSLTLRLDFIAHKQLPLLRAYSELTNSINDFDHIVNDQMSSQKRTTVQPYAQHLRQQAKSFCYEVIAHVDKPQCHAAIAARSREFQNDAAVQIQGAEDVLHVHRHPEWMRVGVRLMMGIVHLASAFFSRGECREYHHNRAAQLFHDEPPVPKSEAISRAAIESIKEQLPSMENQAQQILVS